MAQKQDVYREIVRRYMEGKSSDEELEVFFRLLKEGKLKRYLREAMSREERALLDRFESRGGHWRPLAMAAAICGLLIGGAAWYLGRKTTAKASPVAATISKPQEDIAPGRNHALLTLPGGKMFDLDSNTKTELTLQTGTRLVKNKAGEWVYQAPTAEAAAVVYNTLSAPRGGQFPFVLEDGTRVWLNAASSLRFPTAFQGTTREVYLDGEAYFEVAPDAKRAFQVKVGDEAVTVLGTTFNIDAYPDESGIRTTLLSGSVRVERGGASVLMHPGEIAGIAQDGRIDRLDDDDAVDASVAWRNGYFSFSNDDIQTVMRQISR
ncbi:MAG TPA: FecR family protein, partial [Dinghuibacter sp.]|uniref:FecR family protein n=1 Tax=Dinghuibacter sp. TaxID=2024697 RepID=UPI002C932B62